MYFSTTGFFLALLLSPLIELGASVPANLEDRETPCIALGNCPGENSPASSSPTTSSRATTSAPSATSTSSSRHKCSPAECPKFCDRGNSDAKRSLQEEAEGGLSLGSLDKRFFENSDPDKFPYLLLDQSYTRNICPSSPLKNTYIWRSFEGWNRNYAAALQGLCGCTTIFVVSAKGVFSSHIWELDEKNSPPKDLEPKNYKDTLKDLKAELKKHKDALSGGEAFTILPVDPEHTGNYLYGQTIVNAITGAIKDGSGVEPKITKYTPLDYETSKELGTNKRGTASIQFDPKYESNGKTTRAYRVISEGRVLSLKTGLSS